MSIDWDTLGTVVGGALGGIMLAATAFVTLLSNAKKKVAEAKADVAEAVAARGAADADNIVYKRLTQEVDRLAGRLEHLESSLLLVKKELESERQLSRKLEIKLARLDGFVRSKGLEPPADL